LVEADFYEAVLTTSALEGLPVGSARGGRWPRLAVPAHPPRRQEGAWTDRETQFGDPVAGRADQGEALRDDDLGAGVGRAPTVRRARVQQRHRRRDRLGGTDLRADLLPLLSGEGRRAPSADRPTQRGPPNRTVHPSRRRTAPALTPARTRGGPGRGG